MFLMLKVVGDSFRLKILPNSKMNTPVAHGQEDFGLHSCKLQMAANIQSIRAVRHNSCHKSGSHHFVPDYESPADYEMKCTPCQNVFQAGAHVQSAS